MPANNTAGFATLAGSPRVINITNLSTTPQQVLPVLDTGVSIPSQSVVRCRIYNISTTNSIAFTVGDANTITALTTGSSPTASSAAITSAGTNVLNSTDGIRIGVGQSVEINITANQSIWLVANAGPTPVQVSFFAQNG